MNIEREGNSCNSESRKEDRGKPSSQPGKVRSNGIPVLWAFIVLLSTALVVTGFDWYGKALPTQVIIFSNIAMLAVATDGFFTQDESSTLNSARLTNTLGNLTVSALAFFMNISLFGYIVRLGHLIDDLWGWHTVWIICAGAQVLFLSGLAQFIQSHVVVFLINKVMASDKGVLFIYLMGTVVWGIYLGSQIFGRGIQFVFSDIKVLWGSVLLLLVWAIVGLLLYVTPAVYKMSKLAVLGMSGKRIVFMIEIVTAVMVTTLFFGLLSLWGGVKAVFTVLIALASLTGLTCVTIKYIVEKMLHNHNIQKPSELSTPEQGGAGRDISKQSAPEQSAPEQRASEQNTPELNTKGQINSNQNAPDQNNSIQHNPEQGNSDQTNQTYGHRPNMKDVLITILAYIVFPLAAMYIVAISSDDVRQLLASADVTWQALLDTIIGLLQLT